MHAFLQRHKKLGQSLANPIAIASYQEIATKDDASFSLERLHNGEVATRNVADRVHPRQGKKSSRKHRSVRQRVRKKPKPSQSYAEQDGPRFAIQGISIKEDVTQKETCEIATKINSSLREWIQQRRQESIIKSKSSSLQRPFDGCSKGEEVSCKRDAVQADLQWPSVKYLALRKPYVAHFIFLDIGLGKLSDHPLYVKNIQEFKRFNPNSGVMVWGEKEVNDLVQQQYPHLIEVWNRFPSKWYHIDFARYLILHTHGGIYIDMDMQCTRELPEPGCMDFIDKDDEYPHKSSKTIRFCNNIIFFKDETLYGKLIQFSLERLQTMKIPQTWKRRMMLYKVGARMYHVFCRNNNLQRTAVRDYFYNHRTWSLYKVPFSETGQMHIGRI